MLNGVVRQSVVAGVMAFGATGATLALVGLGVPYWVASLAMAVAAGVVVYAVLRTQPGPDRSVEEELRRQLAEYRAQSATMRHDLRGMLSPALMMSDRLVRHADPGVQRAGNAVVRSIERVTGLLTENKMFMAGDVGGAGQAGGVGGAGGGSAGEPGGKRSAER